MVDSAGGPFSNASRIISPFAPVRGRITIDVDFKTNQAMWHTDVNLPVPIVMQILLQVLNALVSGLMGVSSLIIDPNKPDQKEGADGGKDENN